ncbi:MAG TPA: inositol monophosphatase family protein [Fimbriimonadaceae bacterium]|nr:inositol monophosphatase family protein [Fimbriimonadaceae bacterium]
MIDLPSLRRDLENIVVEAGKLAQECRRTDFRVDAKPDGSVVTNGDRTVETFLRQELTDLVAGTSVWGEEFGWSEPGPGGVWLVDPIDGTTNYSLGSPLWGISVALCVDSKLVLGAVALPDLNEVLIGARGHGVTLNGSPMQTLNPGPVTDRDLLGYCETVVQHSNGIRWPGRQRCAGAFVIEGCFVATGRYRGLVGMREKLYDVAGSVLIAEELGAEVRYATGEPFEIQPLLADRKIDRLWVIFPKDSGFFQ